jgi:Rrf2 family nitric oxide-sensitive transcriptional repressor
VRLTIQTDFALRTLLYLAAVERRSTVAEVAALFGISANHIAKVVNQLARSGYVRSIRGIGGGIELARPAVEIRLGDVIRDFEGSWHLLECVASEGVCVIESFCKLKRVLAEAERLQLEYLDGQTLADIVPTKRQLARVDARTAAT